MDLKSRLARLDRTTSPPADIPPPVPVADGSAAVTSAAAGFTGEAGDPRAALGLETRDTPAGPVWFRDRLCAVAGRPSLGADLAGIVPHPEAARDAGEILFLDTETTGLAGGTGSLAFLIGLAWWDRDGLRVRQLFLPEPGREAPLLNELERVARRFRVIASYNGTTFDLPLLRTRALLARRPDPLAHLAGWDLLTAARRLWGRRLPDLRQATVERFICGRPRPAQDIPGASIPPTYVRYLQQGETAGLRLVFRHNRWDMQGMARILTAVLVAAAAFDPAAPQVRAEPPPWQDSWARGRIAESRRDSGRAAAWMQRAVRDAEPPPAGLGAGESVFSERFLADAIRILKRVRYWEIVARLVEGGLDRHGRRPWLLREAAILYEHRLGRLDLALRHAEALGEDRRLRRLRRKLRGRRGGCRDAGGCL